MIELELLGLDPHEDQLSLNDSDGNRYVLPITDELRALLRKDRRPKADNTPLKPITPREIQAHFRSGMTVADVSELSSLPASALEGLAHPIFQERQYMADNARSFRQGQDVGGLTLDELVVSRLVSRGVNANEITWDATRSPGGPWMLTASYQVADTDYTAQWQIVTKSRTVTAINDEAVWLTETQVPAPTSPWRALNTPPMDEPANVDRAPSVPSPDRKITAMDAVPASSGRPVSIDDVLASLDSKRGQAQPMPSDDDFDGAHPAASEPERARDATILQFPKHRVKTIPDQSKAPEQSVASTPSASSAPGVIPGQRELDLGPEAIAEKPEQAKKKRRNRPTMPSWDEIVFGTPKSDD
ncbi:MAG: septation protein SepH [Arcanobacterium sp.]